jgi:hypothetical protein
MAKKHSSLSNVSAADLRKEIARRQRRGATMMRKRDAHLRKAAEIDAQLRELGSLPGGGGLSGRGRPRNANNLVESLTKVLSGKTMSVTEVADAVQKAGYATTSPNFRTIVNQALIASGKFKRVGRGQYTAKS